MTAEQWSAVGSVAAAVFALAALVVSLFALSKTKELGRESNAIQGRLAAIEEERHARELADRAQAVAAGKAAELRLTHSWTGYQSRFTILNRGPADAKEVRLELLGVLEGDYDVRRLFDGEAGPWKLHPGLIAGDHVDMLASEQAPKSVQAIQCQLSWHDALGDHSDPREVYLPG